MSQKSISKLIDSGKIKVKKKKTHKNSVKNKRNANSSRNYLNFLKKRNEMSNVKNPISNMVSQNVELMNKRIEPINIPDADKRLSVTPLNKFKVVEKPKIDIKLPEIKSNVKKVTVIENEKQPTFSFDRSKKKKKYMKKKSKMNKKKKKTTKKPRKITFTVKKPKKSECDRFKKQTEEIDKKDDNEVDTILKGKGIKTTGKNKKLNKDLLKCASDINIKRE